MSEFRIDKITNRVGDNGPQIAGISTFSGTSGMQLPVGSTQYRGGRGRGILGGSYPANTTLLNKIEIASTGNATSFGLMGSGHAWSYPSASSTRGIFAGGYITPGSGVVAAIEHVIFSSGGGGNDFGDLLTGFLKQGAGFSDSTRGVLATGAAASPAPVTSAINFITMASTGSESSFGDALVAARGAKGLASPTRGVFARGGNLESPAKDATNVIEYVTIQSKGNSVEFGDRTSLIEFQGAAASNTTRGILAGGYTSPANNNIIDYITIATTGNATDFGDLTTARHGGGGMSSATRAVFGGMWDGAADETMDYVTISSTGNAIDFGDTTAAIYYSDGCSDSHGGLG